jgi:hypothetical protein
MAGSILASPILSRARCGADEMLDVRHHGAQGRERHAVRQKAEARVTFQAAVILEKNRVATDITAKGFHASIGFKVQIHSRISRCLAKWR